MHVTGRQLAAARSLLDWSQAQLAVAADVTEQTFRNWEGGRHLPRQETIDRVCKVIEDRGVEFTNGGQPGVRYKAKPPADETVAE